MGENENKVPLPPGGELPGTKQGTKAAVVEPPKGEPAKPASQETNQLSWWERGWLKLKTAAEAVGNKVRDGANWALGQLGYGLSWGIYGVAVAYSWTLRPLLEFVEEWVPGAKYLRGSFAALMAGFAVIGIVLGALAYGAMGWYLAPLGIVVGPAIVFWVLATTPALWGELLLDVYLISLVGCALGVFGSWLGGCGLIESMGREFVPGFSSWLRAEPAPAAA